MKELKEDVTMLAETLEIMKNLIKMNADEIISVETSLSRRGSIHLTHPEILRSMFRCETEYHDDLYNKVSTHVGEVEIFALEEK